MKNLNICIDIDGTTTTAYDWLDRANIYFEKELEDKDVIHYEIHRVLGISPEEYKEFYEEYKYLIHLENKPRKSAQEVINRLSSRHSIHFVTAREKELEYVTRTWLRHNSINYDSLTLLGSHRKVETARQLQADLFIEDRYENALELSEAGFKVILMDCNYNRLALPEAIVRVSSWTEIEAIVKKLEKENLEHIIA